MGRREGFADLRIEITERAGLAAAARRLKRSFDVGWLFLLAVVVGWLVIFALLRDLLLVAISAAACWLVVVLFLVDLWDLVALLTNAPHPRIGKRFRVVWNLTLLPPALLVAGALLGHFFW